MLKELKDEHTEPEETLGFRMRRARMWRGRSQSDLARHIGVSPNALSAIERGQVSSPGSDLVRRVARELRVSADFLLGLSDELPQHPVRMVQRGA